jgi:predicted phage tail component-like protein
MRAVGTDNAWFSYAGRRNDEFDVRMVSMPTRPHPARKGKLVDIPGVHGKLFQDEGVYDRILVTVRVIANDNANIDDVNAWLSGEGLLIFGDEPDRAYKARITKEFGRNNRNLRLRGQEFTVVFDCEPFRYEAVVSNNIVLTKASIITNPGTVESQPLIRVNCAGSGTLMIGDDTLIFEGVPEYVIVDCAAKIAYTGSGTVTDPLLLATQYVTGDWIEIEPGEQAVSFNGDISSVEIAPRWRWL